MPSTPTRLRTGTACRICRAPTPPPYVARHQLEPPGDVGRRGVPEQRHAAPGEVGELEEPGGRPGEVPVEDAGDPVPREHHVVRRHVVVPDQLRTVDGEEPPGPLVDEAVDRVVQLAGPAGEVLQLRVGEQRRVEVDDRARQVGQHLAAAGVDAEHLGHGPQPALPVEQPVDRGGPRSCRPAHGLRRSAPRRRRCRPRAGGRRAAPPAARRGTAGPAPATARRRAPRGRASAAASCSCGTGSPSTSSASSDPERVARPHRLGAGRAAGSPRTPQPSSSRTSRTTASAGSSPGSTLPPGSSHRPAASGGCVRRVASTRPCRTTAAPTTSTSVVGEGGTVRMMPVSRLPSDCPRGAFRAAPRRAPAAQRRPCRGGRRPRRPARRPRRAARRARRPRPHGARGPGPRAGGRRGASAGTVRTCARRAGGRRASPRRPTRPPARRATSSTGARC